MRQQRLDHCAWCQAPATCDVVVKPQEARITARGAVVTAMERRLPACDDCRRSLTRHETQHLVATYQRAEQLAGAEQCKLF